MGVKLYRNYCHTVLGLTADDSAVEACCFLMLATLCKSLCSFSPTQHIVMFAFSALAQYV